jgi:hypothetical protein
MYYGDIFEIFCSVVSERCRDGASSIAILREICNDSNELKVLITGLAYIHANPSFLSQPITKCCESCILEEDDLVDFEDLKDLSVSDIVCYFMQDLYHVMWNVHFLDADHSTVMATQIYDIQVKMTSVIPCSSASLFEILTTFGKVKLVAPVLY